LLRDKSLIPLSRQHQHALALCVRIDRAQPIPDHDLEAWQAEIHQQFQQEIKVHFDAEEHVVFPVARTFPELIPLVEDLLAEHQLLRTQFYTAETSSLSAEELPKFAAKLSAHIRKEERRLFEQMQQLMTAAEMTALGVALEEALEQALQSCILPTEATRLQPKKTSMK
jgi:hemerythrin-like domain-containing protein